MNSPRALMWVSDGTGRADWPTRARAAAEAGVEWIQLREKALGDRALLSLSRAVVDALVGTTTRVLVNARPDVAQLAGAAGVQLPERGLAIEDVRRAFPGLMIGASCHSAEGVERAVGRGADLALLGPTFPTTGKERGIGLEPLALASRTAGIPVFAIGGIDAHNAVEVWGAGVSGIAAIRAFENHSIAEAARFLRRETA